MIRLLTHPLRLPLAPHWWLAALCAAGLALVGSGCTELACGEGTHQVGQECLGSALTRCGEGTVFANGYCVPAPDTSHADASDTDASDTDASDTALVGEVEVREDVTNPSAEGS